MFKLLTVDDGQRIREVIETYAEFEGHEIMEAKDGLEVIQPCKENNFDVVIADTMMPHLDGFSAHKEIRKTKDIPVLMLSARDEEYNRLFGFEIGIDDYVVELLSPKELLVHLNIITSRHQKLRPGHELKFEGLEIDQDGREVHVDHNRIELILREYEILLSLTKNDEIVLSREKFLDQIWGYGSYEDSRTVNTHIKMLRNSLGGYRKFIVTVRGVGYRPGTRV